MPQAPLLAVGVAVWSIKVTRALVRKRSKNGDNNNGDTGGLKVLVTGHSLGGTVAIWGWVLLLLHDIPATAQHLEKDARSLAAGADFKRFKREAMDVWYAAIGERGLLPGLSFDLVGGHIFNPGAIPAIPEAPRAHVASNLALGGRATHSQQSNDDFTENRAQREKRTRPRSPEPSRTRCPKPLIKLA